MESREPLARLRRALWDVRAVQSMYNLVCAQQAARALDGATPGRLPILVYQMAKVGSSTVTRTLEAIGLGRPVHHVHYLMPPQLRTAFRDHLRARLLPYDWCLGRALGPRLRRGVRGGFAQPLQVVTLVRDPVARELSGIFQVPAFTRDALGGARAGLDAERVLRHLERRFLRPDICRGAGDWFDRELLALTGIDVFSHRFPRERGYWIQRTPRVSLLLLRMEDLDRRLGPALADFLELPEAPKVVRANERRESRDGDAYRAVVERFRLPRARLESIYAGRLPRHFYGPEEIAGFIARWCAA